MFSVPTLKPHFVLHSLDHLLFALRTLSVEFCWTKEASALVKTVAIFSDIIPSENTASGSRVFQELNVSEKLLLLLSYQHLWLASNVLSKNTLNDAIEDFNKV